MDLHDGFNSLVSDAKALPTDTLTSFMAAFAVVDTKVQSLETQNQAAFSGANQFDQRCLLEARGRQEAEPRELTLSRAGNPR